jgi:hypothetical protein
MAFWIPQQGVDGSPLTASVYWPLSLWFLLLFGYSSGFGEGSLVKGK